MKWSPPPKAGRLSSRGNSSRSLVISKLQKRPRVVLSSTSSSRNRWSSSSRLSYDPALSSAAHGGSSSYYNEATSASMMMAPTVTNDQLQKVFTRAAIPMVGFGFVDQTIMLQAGHAIDCSIGVAFSLSTLTSAALGQVVSDGCGALFSSTLERLADKSGVPNKAHLSPAQKALKSVQRAKFAGAFVGIIAGCVLGLVNLLFIDTDHSSTLKLQAVVGDHLNEFAFTIEASNAHSNDDDDDDDSNNDNNNGSPTLLRKRRGASSPRTPTTRLTVRGPDVDGVLASMTAALSAHGCSLVELHAGSRVLESSRRNDHDNDKEEDEQSQQSQPSSRRNSRMMMIEDVFHVVKRETQLPFDDDELEDLAKTLLEATRTPTLINNAQAVRSKLKELEALNDFLHDRVQQLEQVVIAKQISVIPSSSTS